MWEANEYPQLAVNEYFYLSVTRKYGLDVPPYRLAENAMEMVIDRFDLRMDGTYCGFEDFCVLNARRTHEKSRGSYETSVMKLRTVCKLDAGGRGPGKAVRPDCPELRASQWRRASQELRDCLRRRSGRSKTRHIYDLVTTSVYLPNDGMALTLNGTTKWASTKELQRLGDRRMGGTPSRVRQILERVEAAIEDTSKDLQAYIQAQAEFMEIGNRML